MLARRLPLLLLLTLGCSLLLWLVAAAPARAAYSCTVDLFPTRQLGLASGYEVGYRMDCNFAMSGYHVNVGDRIGAPRDRDGSYPGNHAPNFVCTTPSNDQSREFSCVHHTYPPSPASSTYGTGWWQVNRGAAACAATRMRWVVTIYDAAGTARVRRTVDINCGERPAPPSARPVEPAPLDLSMSRREVGSYIREMIRDNTNGRVRRLRSRCGRRSYRSFACRLSWRIGRYRYRGRTSFVHELGQDPGTVYWNYVFRGKRRRAGCAGCVRRLRW